MSATLATEVDRAVQQYGLTKTEIFKTAGLNIACYYLWTKNGRQARGETFDRIRAAIARLKADHSQPDEVDRQGLALLGLPVPAQPKKRPAYSLKPIPDASNVVLKPVLAFLREHGTWSGTAAELLTATRPADAAWWPKGLHIFGRYLKAALPAIEREGFRFTSAVRDVFGGGAQQTFYFFTRPGVSSAPAAKFLKAKLIALVADSDLSDTDKEQLLSIIYPLPL